MGAACQAPCRCVQFKRSLVLHLVLLPVLPCSKPFLWSRVPGIPAACYTHKDWHRTLSNLAFSVSGVTSSLSPYSSRFLFSLVFLCLLMYLQKPSLLPFTSFVRLNSRSALAFIHARSDKNFILLLGYQPLFQLLYISCLSTLRSSWLIHMISRTDCCHLCLISCLLSWIFLQLRGGLCISTSEFRLLFFPEL